MGQCYAYRPTYAYRAETFNSVNATSVGQNTEISIIGRELNFSVWSMHAAICKYFDMNCIRMVEE